MAEWSKLIRRCACQRRSGVTWELLVTPSAPSAVCRRAEAPADGTRPSIRLGEGQVVDVPPSVVLVNGQRLLASGKGDADGRGGIGLPTAGVRGADRSGQVGPGGAGDVERVGHPGGGGQPQRHRVGAGGGNVDRVAEPLPGPGPADVVTAPGVTAGFEVDAVRPVAVGAAVDRRGVVACARAAGAL